MHFQRLLMVLLIIVSDIAVADGLALQVLHSRIEKWDAIERCINKDTALLGRLRCSLAPMPTSRLASLAPRLSIYATLNSLTNQGLGLA
jgi:hypothetical protein